MSSVTNVNHDQAVDLAWIVALWTAIHRRDPASHEGLRIDVGAGRQRCWDAFPRQSG